MIKTVAPATRMKARGNRTVIEAVSTSQELRLAVASALDGLAEHKPSITTHELVPSGHPHFCCPVHSDTLVWLS